MITGCRTVKMGVSLLAFGLLLVSGAACQAQEQEMKPGSLSGPAAASGAPAATPAPADAKDGNAAAGGIVTIKSATQAMVGDVRIGASNIWEAEYTTDKGVKSKGLTALLWISVRSDPSKDQRLRVHPGQTFKVPGHDIEVLGVTDQEVKLSVTQP